MAAAWLLHGLYAFITSNHVDLARLRRKEHVAELGDVLMLAVDLHLVELLEERIILVELPEPRLHILLHHVETIGEIFEQVIKVDFLQH